MQLKSVIWHASVGYNNQDQLQQNNSPPKRILCMFDNFQGYTQGLRKDPS